MSEKEKVEAFLAQQHIAVVGYSRNAKKFGAQVFDMLKTKGYQAYAVNPAGGITPAGEPVYSSLSEMPELVKAALIVTKPEITNQLIGQAAEKGLTHVWVQQMSENQETISILEDSQINFVVQRCIFMHANPTGFHKFHRWLVGLFGRLPK
jgi:uncharacterized protein